MHNPWTWTTLWGLPEGVRGWWLGEGGKGRKIGTTVIAKSIKYNFKDTDI